MKKLLVCFIVVLGVAIICNLTFAQQQKTQEQQQREVLIANLTALRNQELRVAVLQQLMDEETAQLMRMQAIFSDQYNLDPNKLRAGMYIYDDQAGKFVEKDVTGAPGAGAITPGTE